MLFNSVPMAREFSFYFFYQHITPNGAMFLINYRRSRRDQMLVEKNRKKIFAP